MLRSLLTALVVCLAPACVRAEDRFFDSGGVRIRYTVQGEGEPVLLIHGFSADVEKQWVLPGIVKRLARQYKVIALDNRGHGKSGKPHDPKQYGAEMARDAIRLLDHMKIQKAHVVGYSMGAIITARLVVQHPDRLRSATLGGAGALLTGTDFRVMDVLADSLEQGKGFAPLLIALTPPGRAQPTQERIDVLDLVLTLGNDVKALAAVARGMKGLEITRAEAKGIRVPIQAVVGEEDPLKKGVEELKAVKPGLSVVVVRGADHITAFGKAEFAQALLDFLARNRAK